MRRLLIPLLLIIAIGGAFAFGYLRPVEARADVTNARIRLPVTAGLPAAGYFDVAFTQYREEVTSVTSTAAQRIEMHMTSEENGVSRMQQVERFSAENNDRISAAPGGRHLMIYGLSNDLRPGGTIPLTFTFLHAPSVTVNATLEAPPGGAPAMDMNHMGHAGH